MAGHCRMRLRSPRAACSQLVFLHPLAKPEITGATSSRAQVPRQPALPAVAPAPAPSIELQRCNDGRHPFGMLLRSLSNARPTEPHLPEVVRALKEQNRDQQRQLLRENTTAALSMQPLATATANHEQI